MWLSRIRLLSQEPVEQPVESRRALELGQVAGALEDLEPGVGQAPVIAERSLDRDDAVVVAPDDEGRDLDLVQPLPDVVAEERPHSVGGAGASQGGLDLLPEQLRAQAVGVAEEAAEGEVAGAAPGQA